MKLSYLFTDTTSYAVPIPIPSPPYRSGTNTGVVFSSGTGDLKYNFSAKDSLRLVRCKATYTTTSPRLTDGLIIVHLGTTVGGFRYYSDIWLRLPLEETVSPNLFFPWPFCESAPAPVVSAPKLPLIADLMYAYRYDVNANEVYGLNLSLIRVQLEVEHTLDRLL